MSIYYIVLPKSKFLTETIVLFCHCPDLEPARAGGRQMTVVKEFNIRMLFLYAPQGWLPVAEDSVSL